MASFFPTDLFISATVGIMLSTIIVIFSPRLMASWNCNSVFVMDTEESEAVGHNCETLSVNKIPHTTVKESLPDDIEIHKSRKLQKVLGMLEHEVRSALQNLRSEDLLIKRTRKLQRVLGMDEQDIRQATKSIPLCGSGHWPKEDNRPAESVSPEEEKQHLNWFKVLDGFIIFVLFAMFCYFFNFSTNGDFGRVIVGLFPREFEVLGLKERLERISPTDLRYT